jgi:hypothetical protein
MQRDKLPYSKARRVAIEEMRAGKLPDSIKVDSIGADLNGGSPSRLNKEKMDDVLALMEGENDDDEEDE